MPVSVPLIFDAPVLPVYNAFFQSRANANIPQQSNCSGNKVELGAFARSGALKTVLSYSLALEG